MTNDETLHPGCHAMLTLAPTAAVVLSSVLCPAPDEQS